MDDLAGGASAGRRRRRSGARSAGGGGRVATNDNDCIEMVESRIMSEISRVALFGKLNALGYRAIESATVFCKMRGNPYVELLHWFHQILQLPDSDLHRVLRHFGVDSGRLARDLTESLDRLPRGATAISDLSS